jgi:porin
MKIKLVFLFLSLIAVPLRAQSFLSSESETEVRQFKPFLKSNTLTQDWFGYGNELEKRGINLGFSTINEVWGNTMGGLRPGCVTTSLMQAATSVDLEKFMGWKGASFYSRWLYLYGQDPSANLVGDIFTVSNIAGYSTLRNIDLWIEQKFFDEKVALRIGQLEADSDFAISDYGALFINSTFGWPAFLYTSIPNSGPNYPVGAPGVYLKLKPIEKLSLKLAAFQGNVYPQNVNNHGFDWNLSAENGFFYMSEADYYYECGLPGEAKAGAWFYAGNFPSVNNPNVMLWGNTGYYGIIDQMLYCPPTCKETTKKLTDEGLGVFGRIAYEPSDRNFLDFYCDTGFNYRGLLPTRHNDILGISFAYGQVSNGMRSSQTNLSSTPTYALPNGVATALNDEMAFEATYVAAITPWLTLQPDVQYILHPGATSQLGNALVLGIRATVVF